MNRLFKKWSKIRFQNRLEATRLKVVADAAIASAGIAEGKLVPLIIVDTTNRPDVEQIVQLHECMPPGDVEVCWAEVRGSKSTITLVLSFTRPVEAKALIDFQLPEQAGLVDVIVRARVLYLQPGRVGDRLIRDVTKHKIFVEIPDTGFGVHWEKMFRRAAIMKLRQEGSTRSEAKHLAPRRIADWRQFTDIRMRHGPDVSPPK